MPLPAGPRSPPLVQIARWVAQPLQMLDDYHQRFGSVFTLSSPREGQFVVIADPILVREIFKAPNDVLLAGVGNATILEPMLGKYSLLTLDGDEHLRQRKLLTPAFHGSRVQGFTRPMREITEAAIETWPRDTPFALHPSMQSITLDVILQTVFGVAHARSGRLRSALVELLDVVMNPWLLFGGILGVDPFKYPWLEIAKLKRLVDDELYAIIREARAAAAAGDDVLAMMVGQGMSDVEIRDELITLLLAGHETTATALAWTFDQLLANPATLARLRHELASGGDDYLDGVIRETLRIRPIVPLVGRHVAKPYRLGKWTLPVGTRVAPSIYLLGRRPDAYPDPEQFRPERWLGVKPDPYTWLPFGGGTRRCIGMAFAQQEMRVVLQTIVPRVDLERIGGPARVKRRGITLAPADGTRVVLRRRHGAVA